MKKLILGWQQPIGVPNVFMAHAWINLIRRRHIFTSAARESRTQVLGHVVCQQRKFEKAERKLRNSR